MKHNRKKQPQPRMLGVAPLEKLREDFAALDARTVLRCAHDVEELLLMQSVEGHAHAGHGLFYGRTYPNTTQDDIARALRRDPAAVKASRQELIDEIRSYAQLAAAGRAPEVACSESGEPLLRCGSLRNLPVDPHGVMQGLFAGGLRDDPDIRRRAKSKYGVDIGYGECRMVNRRVLSGLGITGYDLARESHEEELSEYERAGLFGENGNSDTAYMYVRHRLGPGASDDAAIVMAGKLWGISAAVGCFLADAIDTLEKYVPQYSDQDSDMSEFILHNYRGLDLTDEDSVNLAYLAAIPDDKQGRLPDSSLRHLLEVDRKTDQCALESHLAFVAELPFSRMELDHGECDNEEFYQYIEARFADWSA